MRHLYIPTIASTYTVLSTSLMLVEAVWRLMPVWAKEMHDDGYGRSSPRKERSWTRTSLALRMSSFSTTLRSACMVLIALRASRFSEAMRERTVRGGGRASRRDATRRQAQLTPYQRRSRAVW